MPTEPDVNTAALLELAQVKGQLSTVIQLLQQNHAHTNQRLDDLSRSVDSRFDKLDDRLSRVEDRERSTALRTASYGAGAAALVTAAIEAIKHVRP